MLKNRAAVLLGAVLFANANITNVMADCHKSTDNEGEGAGVHFSHAISVKILDVSAKGNMELMTLIGNDPEKMVVFHLTPGFRSDAKGKTQDFSVKDGEVRLHFCSTEKDTGGGCHVKPAYKDGVVSFTTPNGSSVKIQVTCKK